MPTFSLRSEKSGPKNKLKKTSSYSKLESKILSPMLKQSHKNRDRSDSKRGFF